MKQINSIIGSNDSPHILAGGLNSLDETDYSSERWSDIVKVRTAILINKDQILNNHIYCSKITISNTYDELNNILMISI